MDLLGTLNPGPTQARQNWTQAQIEQARELAQQLGTASTESAPIYSPWAGAARMADALVGDIYQMRGQGQQRQAQQYAAESLPDPTGAPASSAAPRGAGSGGGAGAPTQPTADNWGPGASVVPMDAAKAAIAANESGGDYGTLGPVIKKGAYAGDRAYGKYQVMGNDLAQRLSAAGLPAMSPQQFLANPQAQEAQFEHEFGGLMQRYGNFNDAASVWFTGRPVAQAGNASDGYHTITQYLTKANDVLGKVKLATPPGNGALAFSGQPGPSSPGPMPAGVPPVPGTPGTTMPAAAAAAAGGAPPPPNTPTAAPAAGGAPPAAGAPAGPPGGAALPPTGGAPAGASAGGAPAFIPPAQGLPPLPDMNHIRGLVAQGNPLGLELYKQLQGAMAPQQISTPDGHVYVGNAYSGWHLMNIPAKPQVEWQPQEAGGAKTNVPLVPQFDAQGNQTGYREMPIQRPGDQAGAGGGAAGTLDTLGRQAATIAGYKKTAEERATGLAKPLNDAVERGTTAQKEIQLLNQMDILSNQPTPALTGGGPFAGAALAAWKGVGEVLGQDMGTAPAEGIDKLNGALTSLAVREITQRPALAEFKTVMSSNPGLANSPQGRAMLIDMIRQGAQQDVELSKRASDPSMTPENWAAARDKFYQDNPIRVAYAGKQYDASKSSIEQLNEDIKKSGGGAPASRTIGGKTYYQNSEGKWFDNAEFK